MKKAKIIRNTLVLFVFYTKMIPDEVLCSGILRRYFNFYCLSKFIFAFVFLKIFGFACRRVFWELVRLCAVF